MKNIIKNFLSFICIFTFAGIATITFAAGKYNLILFYADWNVYSPQAITTLSNIANQSKQISFEKINVDDSKAFLRMKQLGVMPTNSLPYYFLMDKKQRVLYGSVYNNETEEEISNTLIKKTAN